jgi:hypothetical protein
MAKWVFAESSQDCQESTQTPDRQEKQTTAHMGLSCMPSLAKKPSSPSSSVKDSHDDITNKEQGREEEEEERAEEQSRQARLHHSLLPLPF